MSTTLLITSEVVIINQNTTRRVMVKEFQASQGNKRARKTAAMHA